MHFTLQWIHCFGQELGQWRIFTWLITINELQCFYLRIDSMQLCRLGKICEHKANYALQSVLWRKLQAEMLDFGHNFKHFKFFSTYINRQHERNYEKFLINGCMWQQLIVWFWTNAHIRDHYAPSLKI